MESLYKYDYYRYFGTYKESFRERLFKTPERKYLKLFRKTQSSTGVLKKIYRIRLRLLQEKTQIQIPYDSKIGKGFYIGHYGRIIINKYAIIGNNVNISTGVVIGSGRGGYPQIGNEVFIGANSVVVGNIIVGNDCVIAPNTYINFDFPPHSVVIGSPGKCIPSDNPSLNWIKSRV